MTPSTQSGTLGAPPPREVDALQSMEDAGPRLVREQQAILPPAWRALDRAVVVSTEFVLFLVGAMFTISVTLAVVTRYLLDFSMFWVDASARFLLVWFVLLGAGIALRHGAHVGFELLLSWLKPRRQRTVRLVGYALSVVFFLEMLWGGLYAIKPSLAQTDAGLGVSLVWIVAAVPAGFVLLTYHIAVLIYAEMKRPLPEGPRA
jgi:TRAP-type C4-dicarboxylate transport system permease small subunit